MSEWRDETPTTAAQLTALAAEARMAFPAMELDHDIEWLQAACDDPARRLLVLALRDQGRLGGLAPFFVHPTQLQFSLGEIDFAKKSVQRYALEGSPLTDSSLGATAESDCLRHLAGMLPAGSVVFLRGLPESSALHAALHARGSVVRECFYVVPHGPRYLRCRIDWTGNFDSYLQTLGKTSRKDLRRTLARPGKLGKELRLQRYASEDSVGEFLRLAGGVSALTYQARLLGLGIAADRHLPARLQQAARRSQFLGHVLFTGNQAIAFHYGFVHGRRFYMTDGGYHPGFAELQVGILAFLEVLRDIEHHQDPIDTLDYLYGDEAYKIRTSNRHEPERHFYLIKKSLPGATLALAMTTTDHLSRGIGSLLARTGIKDAVKRLIRRRPAGN